MSVRNLITTAGKIIAVLWVIYICLYYFNRTTNIFVLIRDYFRLPI